MKKDDGKTVFWWIRRDLRLRDNPSLQAAFSNYDTMIPIFILDPILLKNPAARRHSFLFDGLRWIDGELRRRGSRLVVRSGNPVYELQRLASETNAAAIYAGEDYSPYARKRDQEVARMLPLHLQQDVTVHHPESVLKPNGRSYTIFTPSAKPGIPYPWPSAHGFLRNVSPRFLICAATPFPQAYRALIFRPGKRMLSPAWIHSLQIGSSTMPASAIVSTWMAPPA